MNHFHYRDGILHAEEIDLERLATEVGTPAYVYSTATLLRHARVFREAFAPLDIGLYFAAKANGNVSVLATLAREGVGADTVSEGEIRKSLAAGIPAERIVFSGVGKTAEELAFAVEAGIHQINVETAGELDLIDHIAQARGKRAPIVFRVNPDVGAGGHAKITTGSEHNKFGIGLGEIEALYARAEQSAGVQPLGLAVHIGSQVMDVAPFAEAFAKLRALTERLRANGHRIARLDLGGGLGVIYDDPAAMGEGPHRIEAYAQVVKQATAGLNIEVALEPGRIIVANAGIMIARVIGFNERRDGRVFAVLDAGMNDLVRPAMYESHHEIRPVREPAAGTPLRRYDVVGPICESSDSFASDRELPELKVGDLVAFLSAGAYGATMSSTYNMRRLVPEVLVEGGRYAVVRPRQSFEELIGLDRMAPWLSNR